jgi:NTP pyrophosphatase (non-canonical NTP hydrolase)
MQLQARAVAALYSARDVERFGRSWSAEELASGLVGDMGDLAKLVQGKAGVRPRDHLDAARENEFAGCLWSIVILADAYGVDLEVAFAQPMDSLRLRLERPRDPDAPIR